MDALCKRQENADLLRRVDTYLSHDVPNKSGTCQRQLYIPRHLATPSNEILHAIDLAQRLNATLVIGQHQNGKFVSNNRSKHALGVLKVEIGQDRNGRSILVRRNVIDFRLAAGRAFSDIQTIFGTSLLNFHG